MTNYYIKYIGPTSSENLSLQYIIILKLHENDKGAWFRCEFWRSFRVHTIKVTRYYRTH